ncbi:DUF2868 domain-containing protein [Thermodesulfobacteriota bacterium]
MKKANWHIKDIIDLEYFIRHDEKSEDEVDQISLSKRDRNKYLKHIHPLESNGQSLSPSQSIRIWLEHRRELESSENKEEALLPGTLFDEIYHLLKYGFLILGLIVGSGLAFSFLYYKGVEPLNVSAFLGVFVLVQTVLLLLLIVFSLIRILSHKSPYSSIIATSLSRLLAKLIVKTKERGSRKLSGSMRGRLEATSGIFQEKRKTYGSLLFWPIFILAQGFMAAFNIGVVCALLLKVIGSDIAFGWQSTLKISTEWVSELVQAISTPWSWFIPHEIAYPTLSQIEGSHMILKEGIYHMATEDITSWWPFLCLTVLFYGLLPRLIMLVAGLLYQKKAINRIDFTQSVFERLLRRLYTPVVSMEGHPEDARLPDDDISMVSKPAPLNHSKSEQGSSYVILIPDDIMGSHPQDDLLNSVSKITGNTIKKQLNIGEDEEQDNRVLEEIAQIRNDKGPLNIFLIQEAWQPPIREDLMFIKQLRKSLGPTSKIKVGLIGRPKKGKASTIVKEEEWKVWNQKIKALSDPNLSLERLI